MGADRVYFVHYLEDLENEFMQGVDWYPKSRVDAHHMLVNWKQDPPNLVCLTSGNDGVQFTNMAITEPELTTQQHELTTQQQEPNTQEANNKTTESKVTTLTTITTRTPTADTGGYGWCPGGRRGGCRGGPGCGQDRSMITCFQCGQCGHYAAECDATTEEVEHYCRVQTQMTRHGAGEQLFNAGVLQDDPNSDITTSWMFNQVHIIHDQTHIESQHGGCLPLEWVLLDNQSTIYVFVNRRLLRNIRQIVILLFYLKPIDE